MEALEFFSLVTNCSSITLGKKADVYSCVEVVAAAYGSPCRLIFFSVKREISSSVRRAMVNGFWRFEQTEKDENLAVVLEPGKGMDLGNMT